jgi:hypothetical protein
MPVFRDFSPTNRTAENGLLSSAYVFNLAFLRSRKPQSIFEIPQSECVAITNRMPCECGLAFGALFWNHVQLKKEKRLSKLASETPDFNSRTKSRKSKNIL